MAFDYSKSKSYQKIVSKAKSYSSKGRTSLKAQKARMGERRSIFSGVIKNIGAKQIRELNNPYDKNQAGKIVKFMNENRAKGNELRIAAEKAGLSNSFGLPEYYSIMAALKKDNPVDMEKAYREEQKRQKAISRKIKMNNYGRDLYAKRK